MDMDFSTPPVPTEGNLVSVSRIIALMVFIVLVTIVGGVAYYLGAQDRTLAQTFRPSSKTSFQPMPSPLPEFHNTEPEADPTLALSTDWRGPRSEPCHVTIPLPPEIPPFVETDNGGASWQFEEYDAHMFFFQKGARVIFRGPNSANDYVAGEVEVYCSPNDAGYTTESLMSKLESEMPEGISVAGKSKTHKWGMPVNIVRFRGGFFNHNDHYIFATPERLYLVRSVVMSPDTKIQATTGLILDNLSF